MFQKLRNKYKIVQSFKMPQEQIIYQPNRTLVHCSLAAVSVFVVTWLRIRPLGIFCLGLLTIWIYKTRCNFQIESPPEFQQKYQQLKKRIRDLRQEYPKMFCVIAGTSLSALAVLGHFISGSTVVLIGLIIAAIISSKYNFTFVKCNFSWPCGITHDTELHDEFMPEENDVNLFVLQRASSPNEDVADPDDTSDEIPSEFLIPDVIPEIDEHSTDEEEFLPVSVDASNKNIDDQIVLAAAAGDSNKIEFKKGHFKRDSSLSTTSSSSEESLSKGLKFPDHNIIDNDQSIAQPRYNLRSSNPANAILPSLMSGLVQWSMGNIGGGEIKADSTAAICNVDTKRKVTALDSSDESDFEILESDDFK